MRRHMKAVFVSTLFAALLLLAPGCAIGPHEGLSSPGSEQSAQTEQLLQAADLASLPAFSGEPVAILADNRPSFSEADLAREPFLEFAPLDSLGRCGAAFALLGPESMPEEERGSIGDVEPSGWHLVKYDIVDGKYLYNRCHLIAHRLCGENANERNLITGTRFLNVDGMLPYEDAVASYIEATGNHVLMRVTPLFEGDELVARGVQIEAQSIEDGGAGVRFNVYAYNAQPGVGIDYATGESWLDGTIDQEEPLDASRYAYILNSNTKRFHRPDCPSVEDMGEGNKQGFDGTREEAIARGYEPCGRCDP